MLSGIVDCQRFFEMVQRELEIAEMQEGGFQCPVPAQRESWIRQPLRQTQEFLGDVARSLELCAQSVKRPQTPENFRNVGRVAQLLIKFSCLCVNSPAIRRSVTLDRDQRHTECEM